MSEVTIKVEPVDQTYETQNGDEEMRQKTDASSMELLDVNATLESAIEAVWIKSEPESEGEENYEEEQNDTLEIDDVKDRLVKEILQKVTSDSGTAKGVLLECFHCGHKTPDMEKLRIHIELRHTGFKLFREKHERYSIVVTRKEKRRHMYKCSICLIKYDSRFMLRDHIFYDHEGERPFGCEYCPYSGVTQADLKSHVMFKHTKERPFKCGYCTYDSASSGAVRRHLQVKHPDLPIKMSGKLPSAHRTDDPNSPMYKLNKRYKCDLCEFVAKFKSQVEFHYSSKHCKERPYQCSYCTYRSVSKSRLRYHIIGRHTDERLFKCTLCSEGFMQKKRLNKHIEVKHLKLKQYSCQFCGFKAAYSDNLKRHVMSLHTDEKPHGCEYCSYRTSQSGNLKRHVLLKHSLDRPVFCKICSYFTSKPRLMEEHVSKKHSDGKDRRMCPHCAYSTNRARYLRNHIAAKHSSEKPYECKECDYRTSLVATLKAHVKSKHSEKNFPCTLCDFVAISENVVKAHINSRHNVYKAHRCLQCEFVCHTKKLLYEHTKTIHPKRKKIKEEMEIINDETKFLCRKCDYKCTEEASLKQHVNEMHTRKINQKVINGKRSEHSMKTIDHPNEPTETNKVMEYKCTDCSFVTIDQRTLSKHVKRHRSVKTKDLKAYQCESCRFSSDRERFLKKHVWHKHPEKFGVAIQSNLPDIKIESDVQLADCADVKTEAENSIINPSDFLEQKLSMFGMSVDNNVEIV